MPRQRLTRAEAQILLGPKTKTAANQDRQLARESAARWTELSELRVEMRRELDRLEKAIEEMGAAIKKLERKEC